MKEIHGQIENIINEVLEIPNELKENRDDLEMEIDSLTYMQIVVLIEEYFGIEIPDELLIYDGKDTLEKVEAYIMENIKL